MSSTHLSAQKRPVSVEDWTAIVHRNLTYDEAEIVVGLIKDETTITGYSIREWMSTRDVMVCVNPATGTPLGVVLIHHLFPRWSEVAVVLVMPEWRGHGIGARLVEHATAYIERIHRKPILFYCRDSMERIVVRLGFDTYANEAAYIGRSWARLIFLRALYEPQWRAESYRRREMRRKARSLQCDFRFKIAVPAQARESED